MGQNLFLSLDRCHEKFEQDSKCKTESEIDDYFNGNYLILIENTQKFQKLLYNDAAIVS